MRQEILCNTPAFIEFTDLLVPGDFDVFKENLTKWRLAADELDGSHRYAGGFHIEKHETDTLVPGDLRVSSDQAKHPVTMISVGCPYL